MAKYMRMENLLHWNKTSERQPTPKPVLTRNGFMSKKSSHKKQMMMKEANHTSKKNRFKIMVEKSNKSLIIISTNQKPYPASIRLLGLIGPFIDCVTIQGLSLSGFMVVVALVLVAASLLGLFEYLKMWRWLRIFHQLMARKSVKQNGETRSKAVDKWAWIEDLVTHLDVSGIDDLFIATCILVGLGFLCGFLVLLRRFHSKNFNQLNRTI